VDFTREPIIETVITPKEGCKLVVRSSKSAGQEEYFVDAVEVISFGHSFFFRSMERPKAFLVPANDYEILEVREARMVLKNVGIDRTIKIAGGREAHMRPAREISSEKVESHAPEAQTLEISESTAQPAAEKTQETRIEKKRDRRRNYRRRRGREGGAAEEQDTGEEAPEMGKVELQEPLKSGESELSPLAQQVATTSILTSLLPPPPTLISETISRYKHLFKDAFYTKEEAKSTESSHDELEKPSVSLEQPQYGSFEVSEEEEEEIYQQRRKGPAHFEEHAKDSEDQNSSNHDHSQNDEDQNSSNHHHSQNDENFINHPEKPFEE